MVELLDHSQRVLVRRVPMEKLVLHEIGQGAELGQVPAEKPDPVHLPQHPGHIALAAEDALERLPIGLLVAERPADQRRRRS